MIIAKATGYRFGVSYTIINGVIYVYLLDLNVQASKYNVSRFLQMYALHILYTGQYLYASCSEHILYLDYCGKYRGLHCADMKQVV